MFSLVIAGTDARGHACATSANIVKYVLHKHCRSSLGVGRLSASEARLQGVDQQCVSTGVHKYGRS